MRMFRRLFGRFWPLFAIGIMLTLFLGTALNRDTLNVYTGTGQTPQYTVEGTTEGSADVPSFLYENSEVSARLRIPEGWQHVVKDGYDTFVHSASASSVQVQVLEYYPMVNNATYEQMADACAGMGYQISGFSYVSDSSYCLTYQSQGLSGVTDYIEDVYWDRSHVVKVVITVNDSNYARLEKEIASCRESFLWDCEDPLPEGCCLIYQAYGDFEYAVPDTWVTGSTDEAFYAYDEGMDAVMTVNVLEDPSPLSGISEIDYSDFLANGKSNFALTRFENNGDSIYGEATYSGANGQRGLMQYYAANGAYHYIVTYEFPTDLGAALAPACGEVLAATRIFMEPIVQETETETELLQQLPLFDLSEFGQAPEGWDNPAGTGDTGESASFADALMQVAGISEAQAADILRAWQESGAGNPVYAEAYAQFADSLVIRVSDDGGTDYFVYLTLDGYLQGIKAGSEDGDVIYPRS